MKQRASWKRVVVVLSVLAMSLVCIPGFAVTAMAADSAPVATTNGASAAGASGGEATLAGLSTGTIVAGTIAAAAIVGWVVGAANNGDTTSHH